MDIAKGLFVGVLVLLKEAAFWPTRLTMCVAGLLVLMAEAEVGTTKASDEVILGRP